MPGYEALLTRRRFVALAAAVAGGVLTGEGFGATPAGHSAARAAAPSLDQAGYLTQPDWAPPPIALATPAAPAAVAPGYIFVAPFAPGAPPDALGRHGPLILDDDGEPVWFLPLATRTAMNFRAQRYRGRNVLTWYEGDNQSTYGGSCVIYDATYRELKRVHAGHGLDCDLHEFLITSRDTALVTVYNEVSADLSSVGGPPDGRVVEGIVQELELPSGRVVFEWHSLDHVPLDESFRPEVTSAGNVDYFHLNSIGVAPDGDLLVSSRHTSTVYKVGRRTGKIVWRLGGKKSDFALGPGAAFNFQHDVRGHADGTLTIFDNGATDAGAGDVEPGSRALRLQLDTRSMTATLLAALEPAQPRLAIAMGDVQELPGGNVFVGWGTTGWYSEYGPDGSVLLDARFGDAGMSYRAFRLPWAGNPTTKPAAAARANADGTSTVHASWNGATGVTHWQVRTGPAPTRLTTGTTAARSGFETAIVVPAATGYAVAYALDASGDELGASAPVAL